MAILSLSQLNSLAQQVGLSPNAANTAAAIAMAESGGNTAAYNPETAAGTAPGHGSRGLWQIYGAAHPQYDNASMFDPVANARAMYAISGGGQSWNAWSTYTSGEYRQYLSTGGNTPSVPAVKSGASNSFPMGQCTWWADQRYHDQTGYYVPWNGNAYQWEQGARSSGWQVGTTPPKGIPSIVVMQPNVQGASGLGHVGVVEGVNSDGSATVSNMNWLDPNAAIIQTVNGYPIRQTTIKPGAGVAFVWATGSGNNSNSLLNFASVAAKSFQLTPNANVTAFLVATDDYLTLKNPFDVDTSTIQDNIAGVSFTDPVKWLIEVANNTGNQIIAITIRIIFVVLGLYILLRVVQNFVDTSGSSEGIAKVLQSLGGAAAPEEVAAAAAAI